MLGGCGCGHAQGSAKAMQTLARRVASVQEHSFIVQGAGETQPAAHTESICGMWACTSPHPQWPQSQCCLLCGA